MPDWPRGERRTFLLKSVKTTPSTEVSVLGQTGSVVEYQPANDGQARFEQTPEGLKISVVRAQRIYNNHKWPNPIVVKLKNVEAAVEPAHFKTVNAEKTASGNLKLTADLTKMGSGKTYQVGFEYRPVQSSLNEEFNQKWTQTDVYPISKPGAQTLEIVANNINTYDEIEYRAILYQDGLKIEGNTQKISKLRLD
jgi:alpha-L-fucosidase